MKCFALLLLLCGCQKNRDLLETRLAEVELRRSSAVKTMEAELTGGRKAIRLLKPKVKAGLEEFPAVQSLERIEMSIPFPPELPPLPAESSLEGAEGKRLRERIEDNEARLSAFLAEYTAVREERRHLERQLDAIEKLREGRR